MTAKVRRGLALLVEFGRSFREADECGEEGSETLDEAQRADADAAMEWVEKGGLS
jgi:hypothetical protein